MPEPQQQKQKKQKNKQKINKERNQTVISRASEPLRIAKNKILFIHQLHANEQTNTKHMWISFIFIS